MYIGYIIKLSIDFKFFETYYLTMKRLLPLFVFVSLLTFYTGNIFALELKSIGALSLGGKTYTEWWYTGSNPTYVGTAKTNSDVKLTVGKTTYDTKADATGNWTIKTTDPTGEYDVSLVGDGTTYAFKLHLGKDMPATGTGSTASGTVPTTGSEQIVAILFSLGVILMASYFYFWGSQSNKVKFEKYFLNN